MRELMMKKYDGKKLKVKEKVAFSLVWKDFSRRIYNLYWEIYDCNEELLKDFMLSSIIIMLIFWFIEILFFSLL